jgi:hypothetical protein
MKILNKSFSNSMTPQINFNLKLSQKDVVLQTRKRIVTLEQAGLTDQDYQLLLQDRLVPRPLEVNKHKQLNIVECVWFAMIKELRDCNYSPEIIWHFMLCLFADIVDETDKHTVIEEETSDVFVVTSYSNTPSTLLELLVVAALAQQEDLVLQFTRDGKIGFLAHAPRSESYALYDQTLLSFSVYSILKNLVGAANIPNTNSQPEFISSKEKQVLELARTKDWEKIEIKQVANKSHTNWLLATSKYIVLSNQEFSAFTKTVPNHNRLNNIEFGPKMVKFEYEERLILKV